MDSPDCGPHQCDQTTGQCRSLATEFSNGLCLDSNYRNIVDACGNTRSPKIPRLNFACCIPWHVLKNCSYLQFPHEPP